MHVTKERKHRFYGDNVSIRQRLQTTYPVSSSCGWSYSIYSSLRKVYDINCSPGTCQEASVNSLCELWRCVAYRFPLPNHDPSQWWIEQRGCYNSMLKIDIYCRHSSFHQIHHMHISNPISAISIANPLIYKIITMFYNNRPRVASLAAALIPFSSRL